MFPVLFLVVCLAAATFGKPMARSMRVHEARTQISPSFQLAGPAPTDAILKLRVALVPSDLAGLEKTLLDVSTPGSPLYGQHLSKEEAQAFTAPKPESVAAVHTWLKENGVEATNVSPTGDMLTLSLPVSKASELLDAEFSVFNHTPTGRTFIRTLAYSIPTDLAGHLDFVHPTVSFVQPLMKPSLKFVPSHKVVQASSPPNLTSNAIPASCAETVTPGCLQALYGIPSTQATVCTNQLAVSGFIDQFANQEDLDQFLATFRPDLPSNSGFALLTLDGGENPQQREEAGIEADLDIQYTIGIASAVPTAFVSVGPDNLDGLNGFLDIIEFLLGEQQVPQVLSTSFGFDEPDVPTVMARRLCSAYMQLGARGTSILFSSGDGGVSGSQSQRCTTFIPTFPSGCPFVTSVGATTGNSPEVAASFSSGGFSDTFAQPAYQVQAVHAYLTTLGNTDAGLFNPFGRGFPDISAQGDNVEIVFQGQFGTVAGTSCSAPIVASIIAILNDELAAVNRPPLGFLNPLLYELAGTAVFTDITSGSNPGCNTLGFPARPGWDPVTGLGTPNFAALRAAALGL